MQRQAQVPLNDRSVVSTSMGVFRPSPLRSPSYSLRLAGSLLLLAFCTTAGGQEDSKPTLEPDSDHRWQATVGDWTIRPQRVMEFVKRRLGDRKVAQDLLESLHREALRHLVDRQIILEHLKSTSHAAGKSQLALEQSALEERLKTMDQSFEDYLAARKMTPAEWRNETSWRISWRHFLNSKLDAKALKNFFDQHRRQFDGTQMKVAHILWRTDSAATDRSIVEHAQTIREQIVAGKLSWSQAVQRESVAISSKDKDGEIGWIRWDGPMPSEFSRAAMQLDPGQIAPPVQTPFGVHLIRCLDVQSGTLGPQDVELQLRASLTRQLFHQLADKHRSEFEIKMPASR